MDNRSPTGPVNGADETGRKAVEQGAHAGRVIADEIAHAGEQAARTSADAARKTAERAQNGMRAGLNTATQSMQQISEQFTRTLGLAGPQSQELARKSSQNLDAVTQATSVLAQGAQEISREWFGLAQAGFKKNMDGLNALTRCRSVQDFVAVQGDLVRDNLQHAIDNTRRLSEVSVRVAQDATRIIQAQSAGFDTGRQNRAA